MAILALLALLAAGYASGALREESFLLAEAAEVVATVTAGCARCSWGARGREAAVLVLEVDGRYSQHLLVAQGERPSEYPVALGPLPAGPHRLSVTLDRRATPRAVGEVSVDAIAFRAAGAREADHAALALAPFLYARKGTLERFSDLPLLTWYETEKTPRGERIRYSVVFSHEDGGTPVDRLMATWGRTTDVEFVYAVEHDGEGRVLAEIYQGKDHELVPFAGRREGRHPLLWVVTENNMLRDRGETAVRFAPAPRPVDLAERSREAVMDDHPWTYRVSAQEVRREGRTADHARPGEKGRIPDPRRFVYLEACAPAVDATLAFAAGVAGADGALTWYASDAAGPRFRVSRAPHNFPNGCFQAAVALPMGIGPAAIHALRVQAFTRLPAKDERPLPSGTGRARLLRVNRLFMLDENDEPGAKLLSWTGDVPLAGEGPPYELKVEPAR